MAMSDSPSQEPLNDASPWDGVVIETEYGPRIKGTRIKIYDVYYYMIKGWHHSSIAGMLGLSSGEVIAVVAYIEAHREAVEAVHQEIEERNARGNPPEVQAKLDAIRAELAPFWAERRRALEAEEGHEGNHRGR